MRKPGWNVRFTIDSPCTSRIFDEANPPINACRTLAGSAPALAANSNASPTASMFNATMIWLATGAAPGGEKAPPPGPFDFQWKGDLVGGFPSLAGPVPRDEREVLPHQVEQ